MRAEWQCCGWQFIGGSGAYGCGDGGVAVRSMPLAAALGAQV